jgi:hypothetical protein
MILPQLLQPDIERLGWVLKVASERAKFVEGSWTLDSSDLAHGRSMGSARPAIKGFVQTVALCCVRARAAHCSTKSST